MSSKLTLKIFIEPNGKCPTKGKVGDAGIDVYADTLAHSGYYSIKVHQGDSVKVPLGFRCSLSVIDRAWNGYSYEATERDTTGYYLEIRNRSGVGMKSGFTELASIVDSNYRGIPNYCAAKVTSGQYIIEHGAKIAQMLIHPFVDPNDIDIVIVDTIDQLGITDRGASGFGDSGN